MIKRNKYRNRIVKQKAADGHPVSGFLLLFFCLRASFPRFPQTLHYSLVLQRRQCPLPGFEVQGFEFGLKLGVQLYPAVQLR